MREASGADRAPERFSSLLLRHRGRTGLTQRQLATRVGVNRRALQDWEAGVNCPSAQRLQALIAVLLEVAGLTVGHEADELAEGGAGAALGARDLGLALERRQDWGDAPDLLDFVGRGDELATVRDWLPYERCRLVCLLGTGGIGKTSLAAKLARDVAPAFQRLYWRGLRNAPPVGEWLGGAIRFLSDQRVVPPESEAERLAVLLQLLRDQPSLLVLDNFETVLEPGQWEGRYRDGLAGYGTLLRAVGEARHASCLVVTSREAPPELATLDGAAVHSLTLGGLDVSEGQILLARKQLVGDEQEWAQLIARYGGNGLALKVVGESIRELFDGEIGSFLEEAGASRVFGGIRRLLGEQVERSSAPGQQMLRVRVRGSRAGDAGGAARRGGPARRARGRARSGGGAAPTLAPGAHQDAGGGRVRAAIGGARVRDRSAGSRHSRRDTAGRTETAGEAATDPDSRKHAACAVTAVESGASRSTNTRVSWQVLELTGPLSYGM